MNLAKTYVTSESKKKIKQQKIRHERTRRTISWNAERFDERSQEGVRPKRRRETEVGREWRERHVVERRS